MMNATDEIQTIQSINFFFVTKLYSGRNSIYKLLTVLFKKTYR